MTPSEGNLIVGNAAGRARLDEAVLQELRDLEDEEGPAVLAELVELYTSSMPARLEMLRAAVEDQDAPALARAAHVIKGSSASLGGADLAALAAELECLGLSGTVEGAARRLPELEAEYGRVKRALEDELRRRA